MKKWAAIGILTLSITASAQFGGRRGGGGFDGILSGGNCLVPGTRFGGDGSEDGPERREIDRSGFVYARIRYHVTPFRQHREVPWHHDYPDGDEEFPISLNRLTSVYTTPQSYQIVDIDSEELFNYPFTYMSEPGYLDLLPDDVTNLREYLDRGGFLLVDDFRGEEEFDNLRYQMKKVYPDRDILPMAPSHPIFHVFFEVNSLEMLAPYTMPGRSGPVQFLGLSDPKGHLQVMVDYNNDMSEYWQALDVRTCSIQEAGLAVELGINYAIYAMTH